MAKTTHQKGLELENKFAKYMKEKLGYNEVKERIMIKGIDNSKGVEVDILGIKYDDRSEMFRVVSIITLIISFFGLILSATEIIPFELISFFLVLEVGAIVYAFLSRYFSAKYTAVECKNHEAKINLKMLREFYHQVLDNNQSKDKRYRLTKIIFVSKNGFVSNSLEFAQSKGIECYQEDENDFKKVQY